MKPSEIVQQSIDKWESIVAGTGADDRSFNCPLCQVYLKYGEARTANGICTICPIRQFTGVGECKKSPYTAWINYIHKMNRKRRIKWPVRATTTKMRELAQAEVDFLKHILELQLEKENENI